jgi:hypothetical protein
MSKRLGEGFLVALRWMVLWLWVYWRMCWFASSAVGFGIVLFRLNIAWPTVEFILNE